MVKLPSRCAVKRLYHTQFFRVRTTLCPWGTLLHPQARSMCNYKYSVSGFRTPLRSFRPAALPLSILLGCSISVVPSLSLQICRFLPSLSGVCVSPWLTRHNLLSSCRKHSKARIIISSSRRSSHETIIWSKARRPTAATQSFNLGSINATIEDILHDFHEGRLTCSPNKPPATHPDTQRYWDCCSRIRYCSQCCRY